MGLFSVIPALVKGIKNRDDQGGGIKGAFKAAAKGITGNDDLDLQKQINVNLEKIVENTTNKQPVKAGELPVPDVKQKRKNITSNTMIYQEQKFDPITGELITPMNNSAMLAGGSRPMAAMDDPYQTGQANMNPNFIGNYNGPTTGMLAQEKVENQMEKERRRADLINSGFAKQVEAVKGVNYTPSNNPEENYDKGFEPFGRTSGQAKSIDSRIINGATVLGGNQPTKQSGLGAIVPDQFETKTPQDKKMPIIPAQNPGVYNSYDLSKPEPNEFDKKTSSGTRLGSGGNSEVAWRSYANDVANDRTKSGKGISAKGFSSLRHLESRGETDRLSSGPLKSPTEKIKDGFKKGYDTYLESTYYQDKSMPKDTAGKGIRSLAPSVQENMGYDPLSQERLTQSRRGTKCMRVKRK